jgi:hypothetical protein
LYSMTIAKTAGGTPALQNRRRARISWKVSQYVAARPAAIIQS